MLLVFNETSFGKCRELTQINKIDSSNFFKFTTEVCENTGKFDKKLYKKSQIAGAYFLWFEFSGLSSNFIKTPNDIKKLDLANLIKEYNDKLSHLENLKIVNSVFWKELKIQRIRELNEEFEAKKSHILAYTDPKYLLANRFSEHCKKYANILSSENNSLIMKEWENLKETQKINNANPEGLEVKFQSQLNSNEKYVFARINLIEFGWWNCVNEIIFRVNDDNEKIRKQFFKLFIKVKSECDDGN
jgi:hypothetical protein